MIEIGLIKTNNMIKANDWSMIDNVPIEIEMVETIEMIEMIDIMVNVIKSEPI